MALFNRKKKADAVDMPPELQDYYQAENRERSWMAWLLGLGTLVVTVLLALALFFGGRWVYRKVRNEPAAPSTSQTENAPQDASDDRAETDNDNDESDGVTSNGQNGTDDTSTETPPTSTGTSSTSTSTPSSGVASDSTDLPNAGPADTLAIFVGATVLAYAVHRRFLSS